MSETPQSAITSARPTVVERAGMKGRCVALRGIVLAAALASLALLAAGCGGGAKSPSVASLGTPTSTSAAPRSGPPRPVNGNPANPRSSGGGNPTGNESPSSLKVQGGSVASELKFAACMRSNGVPGFTDPNEGVFGVTGIDQNSPAFQKATQICQKMMPDGGAPSPAQQAQAKTQMLEYSTCMRSHGLLNFPEPNAQGDLAYSFGASSGIDPNSPQFQAAQKACASLAPGAGGPGPSGG